jgi:transcriptional regulator with XRE-family HTH domain
MDKQTQKLIAALKKKRDAEGLSIRGLSAIIGVSFSSLARIERGEGEPDNNSRLRILEWLGQDARDSGLSFENVALVHFRASKNATSKTIHCLLQAADILKSNYTKQHSIEVGDKSDQSPLSSGETFVLSKPEMEAMALGVRRDLGVKETDPLDALSIKIEGVDVFVPEEVSGLSESCLSYMSAKGNDDWSAMSVPLDESNDRWAILRNDKHTIERQRVTFLEECWHILLGHKLTKIAKIADSYGRTYDSNEEHDAFYLASATLLPEEVIKKGVKDKKSASEIADTFGTSPELVEYRIKRLGLWREYKGKQVKLIHKSN